MEGSTRRVVVNRPLESPFLDDELFTREVAPDWEPRASALVAQSPFLDTLAPADLATSLQDGIGESLDEEPYEYREAIEQETDEGYGFRHELDEEGDDEQAADTADQEMEDEFGSFEGFAPKVSAATLRTRIDAYFDLVNTEYTLTNGTKVKGRSQFRYAKSGGIDQAKTRLAKTLGSSFEKKHPHAIHYAVYGRPKPAQIAAITQALIDVGQFDALRKKYSTLTDRQLIRRMQREFGIGIDCAGYVQLAFIYAFTGSDDDPRKTRLNLGLQERRGNERLSDLPSSHFKKLASITDAETGDLLVLRPRDGDIDRAWHTVMIVERTSSGTEHTFLGDASWGTDLYGENAGGIGRRQLVHDTATGEWWDIHPLTGAEAHRNTVGPYAEHLLHGVFRARQSTKTAQPTPELETWLEEAETNMDCTERGAEHETDQDAGRTEHKEDEADIKVEDTEEEGVDNDEEVDLAEDEEAEADADEAEEAIDERAGEIVSHVYEDFEGIEELGDSVEEQPDLRKAFEGDTEQPLEWREKEAEDKSTSEDGEAEEEEAGTQQESGGGPSPAAASVNVLLDQPVDADDKFQLVSKDGKYAKTLGAAVAQKLVEGAMRLTFTRVDPKKEYKLIHIRSKGSRQLVVPANPFKALTEAGHHAPQAKNTYVTVPSQIAKTLPDRYHIDRPVDPILVASSPVLVDLTVDDPEL
jgi:hypothetical protein